MMMATSNKNMNNYNQIFVRVVPCFLKQKYLVVVSNSPKSSSGATSPKPLTTLNSLSPNTPSHVEKIVFETVQKAFKECDTSMDGKKQKSIIICSDFLQTEMEFWNQTNFVIGYIKNQQF